MSENQEIYFEVVRIKAFSFYIDEASVNLEKQVLIQFQHKTGYDSTNNIIDLTLRTFYSYDPNAPTPDLLIDLHVQNMFFIPNLIQFRKEDGKYDLPHNLIFSMVGISISHTRALLAQNTAGTLLQNNILPIANPVEVAKAFYPETFGNASTNIIEHIAPKKRIKKKASE